MKLKKKYGNKLVYIQANLNTKINKSGDKITIEGFGSTDGKDRDNDIVDIKAWNQETIEKFLVNPQMLYGHDTEKSVGEWYKLEVRKEGNKNGLWMEGDVLFDIDIDGIGLFERIRTGTTKTLSIGFIPEVFKFYDKNGKVLADENDLMPGVEVDELWKPGVYRIITQIELVECSIVNIPSNPQATFALKKSLELNKYFIFENTYGMKKKQIEKGLVMLDEATKREMEEIDGVIDGENTNLLDNDTNLLDNNDDKKPENNIETDKNEDKDTSDDKNKDNIENDKDEDKKKLEDDKNDTDKDNEKEIDDKNKKEEGEDKKDDDKEKDKKPEKEKKEEQEDENKNKKEEGKDNEKEKKDDGIDYEKLVNMVLEKLEDKKNKEEDKNKKDDEKTGKDSGETPETSGKDGEDNSKSKGDDSETSQKEKEYEALKLENKNLKEKLLKVPVNLLKQENNVETKFYDFKNDGNGGEFKFYFTNKN